MNEYRAAQTLLEAGYPAVQVTAMLTEAAQWPGRWVYPPDRRWCVVKHMPAGVFEVADCAESEARIAALRRGARR